MGSIVQISIFNTSIEALQETIDVCGLLKKYSLEFIVLEIPSLTSSTYAVDSNNMCCEKSANQHSSKAEESTSHEALDVFTSRTVLGQCSEIFEYGSKASTSEGIVPCSVISCHSEKISSENSYRKSFADVFTSRTVPAQCTDISEYGSKASTSEAVLSCSVISCHSESSSTDDSYRKAFADVFTSRTVLGQCSEIFEYGSKASTSEGIVPCSVISCHSEKISSNDSYRKSFLDGLFPNFSPNISNISFDADINNHSVLKSFLLENGDMSASMQAFINSMDAFFEKQTVADFGLIPAISDDPFFNDHDCIVSIVNRMVDKLCDAETDENRVDSVCDHADSAFGECSPLVQSDDLGDQSCTPLEMLEMPKDNALEYSFSVEDNDNASFMTASEMEVLNQDLQSWDVSHPNFSSITDDGSYLNAQSSGDGYHVRCTRSGVTNNRKIYKGKGCKWFAPITARGRRNILCQFRNCSNSFRVGTSKFKLLRHANTHNSNAFSCLHCGFSAQISRKIHAHHRKSPCGLLACKQQGQIYPECVLKNTLDSEDVAQLFQCCFPNYKN